jgi:hypothetical protein
MAIYPLTLALSQWERGLPRPTEEGWGEGEMHPERESKGILMQGYLPLSSCHV